MTVQFATQFIDANIAPGASLLSHAEIPDVSTLAPQSSHWVTNYFLNSLTHSFADPSMKAYAFNFLRRAQRAFSEHILAREATLKFIEGGSQSPTVYAEALFHWECFLGQVWHALEILLAAEIIEPKQVRRGKKELFMQGDGSIAERLNTLYNTFKHDDSKPGNSSAPAWLESDGIQCKKIKINFADTAEILKDIADVADALMNPRTAKASLIALVDTQQSSR